MLYVIWTPFEAAKLAVALEVCTNNIDIWTTLKHCIKYTKCSFYTIHSKRVLGSVIVVFFQSVFHLEMHQNNIFYLKKLFLTSVHQNDLKT